MCVKHNMVFNMSGTPTVCSPHTHKLTYLHTYLHTYHHRPSITLILPLPFSLSLLSLSLKKLVTCGVIRSFNCLRRSRIHNQMHTRSICKNFLQGFSTLCSHVLQGNNHLEPVKLHSAAVFREPVYGMSEAPNADQLQTTACVKPSPGFQTLAMKSE